MVPADIYQPAQWHDFFVMVGGGSAALTGLVFVAMSLNVDAITADTAHRYRATGNLIGLGAVFMLSALVLMGDQNHQAIGAEVLIVSVLAGSVYTLGVIRSRRSRDSDERLSTVRVIGLEICFLLEVVGAIVLIVGDIAGLYMICVGIVSSFYFLISGSWRLFVRLPQSTPNNHRLISDESGSETKPQ